MKNCEQCGIEKELEKFYYNKAKNYYDVKCKSCRKSNTNNKLKTEKTHKHKKVKVVKSNQNIRAGFLNPEYPIPLKKTTDDGFGGKWKYDSTRLNETIVKAFIDLNSTTHKNKHYPILQVKSQNKQQMIDFVGCICMSTSGLIHIKREEGKEYLETYVVNLYGVNHVSQ